MFMLKLDEPFRDKETKFRILSTYFLESDHQKYADSRGKISIENCNNKILFSLKTQIWTVDTNSWSLHGSSSLMIKISQKRRKIIWQFFYIKKKSVNVKEIFMTWIIYFQCGSAIKWILSTCWSSKIFYLFKLGWIPVLWLWYWVSSFLGSTEIHREQRSDDG